MIETSHLQTLVAVAKTGSFSKAAESLHVTQSAISQNVKNLETKVGVNLFSRNGKKVVLTSEGQQLFQTAREYLNKLDKTIHDIQEVKDSLKGTIKIGTLTGLGKSWLSSRVIDFATKYEDINLETCYDHTEELLDAFFNNELDCVIVAEGHVPPGAEKFHIFNEYLTLVMPDSKKFVVEDDIDLETLSEIPTILFDHADALFSQWCKSKLGAVPKKIKKKLVINSHGDMLQAVRQGLGIAVIPTHVLDRYHQKDQSFQIKEKFEIFSEKYYFVVHKEAVDLKRIKVLREFLIKDKPLEKLLTKTSTKKSK